MFKYGKRLIVNDENHSASVQTSKEASLFAQLMNIHIISMIITHKGCQKSPYNKPNIAMLAALNLFKFCSSLLSLFVSLL